MAEDTPTVNGAATNGHVSLSDSPYKAPPPPTNNEQMLAEMREMVENVTFFSRQWFNSIIDRRRDLYEECGYPADPLVYGPGALTADLYRALYDREPMATRVVELMPKETWQVQPLVFEDEDASDITPFEEAWDLLGQQLRPEASWHQDEAGSPIWEYLQRVDILSGIGGFGVLLLGIDDGKNFQEPISGAMMMVTNSKGEKVRVNDSPIHPDEEASLNDLLEADGQREIANPFAGKDEKITVNVRRLNDSEKKALAGWVAEREIVENAAKDVPPPAREGYQNSPAAAVLGARSVPRRQGFKTDTQNPSVGPMRTADGEVIAGGDGPFGTDRNYDDYGYGLGMPPPQAFADGGSSSGDQYGRQAGGDGGQQDQLASAMGPQGGAGGGLGYSLSGTDQQYFGVIMGPSEQPVGPAGDAGGQQSAKPLTRLVLLRAFSEDLVQVVRYEWNIRNPRFGMPVMYRITLNDPREVHSGVGLPLATIFVHWTRVIHVADNLRSSEIFGVPRMRPVLNPILDLQKIRGASAEGYWQSCFDGDTKFFDGNTLKKLKDCVGHGVFVTCADGKKRNATVESFGTRKFVRVELGLARHGKGSRGQFRRFFNVTADHRWLLANGHITTKLSPGDVLAANYFPEQEEPPFDAWGFAHGVVFGDGWIHNKRFGTHKTQVKLYGKKNWMLDRLMQVADQVHQGDTCRTQDGNSHLLFTNRETNMKALPVDGKHSAGYIYWFLQGWFATDGHFYKDRDGMIGLSSSKPPAIEWFFANAPYYGYEIMGYSIQTKFTKMGERSYPNYLMRCKKQRIGHQVMAITDEGLVGEAFCVVEPVTKTFTLEGGVVTGNCFTGLQYQTHPALGGDVVVDKEQIDEAADRYRNKLQRSLVGIGGGWSTIAPSVVDPTPFIDVQKKAICNQLGCPIRVFDGSERGELASSQDDESWDQRKRERQLNYLTPRVIVPFVDRLIQVGVLPEPGAQSKSKAEQTVQNLKRTFGRRWFTANVRKVQGGWMVRNSFKPTRNVKKDERIESLKKVLSTYDGKELDGLRVWVNPKIGKVVVDRMDWYDKTGVADPATDVGNLAEKMFGKANVTYQNEGGAQQNGIGGWITVNATPGDPSQRKPPNLGTGGDPWQTVDKGGNERTDSPSSLQGATKQVQAPFTFIPEGGYSVEWPATDAMSQADKAGIAVQYTQALSAYAQGGCEQYMPFKEYLVHVWKWEEEQAQAVIDATQSMHEDDATLGVPPTIAGQPKEAPDGTQAAADAKAQADQAKAMADAKAKQPVMGGKGGAAGGGLPPGNAGATAIGQKPQPNKQDAKIAATAKAQSKQKDNT